MYVLCIMYYVYTCLLCGGGGGEGCINRQQTEANMHRARRDFAGNLSLCGVRAVAC
jgi:hypothetical protein